MRSTVRFRCRVMPVTATNTSVAPPDELILVGRSSSHFTRVARLFAAEAEVPYVLRVVPNLLSCDPRDFGDNPALRIPVLRTAQGDWYGSVNVCRELVRRTKRSLRVVWPEELHEPLLASAQELVLGAMATEVSLILARAAREGSQDRAGTPSPHEVKMKQSLEGSLAWLDARAEQLIERLPPRDVSYLEVTLFCLVTHLSFRDVLPVSQYENLAAFCRRFGERSSARVTAYHFDA